MEADSTTYEGNCKEGFTDAFPFPINPGNQKFYMNLTCNSGIKSHESQIVDKLQSIGLLPKSLKCPNDQPNCQLICKQARVIDRVQWLCEGCGKRQPIRSGSFFLRLQCSLLQTLQIILAWCEDADCPVIAEHFGVKLKVVTMIYDKLDDLAIKEHKKTKLGGENTVVLAEMYPDCLNRLSPDTTDQPQINRILMLADTTHIPTFYKLHVIREDLKKQVSNSMGDHDQSLRQEIEQIIWSNTEDESIVVTGSHVPPLPRAAALQQLAAHCDNDMQHFLSSKIWRQAIALCVASRSLCSHAPAAAAADAQRYLDTALYRLRYDDGFYQHFLGVIAAEYTDS